MSWKYKKTVMQNVVHKLCAILGVRFNDTMAELTEYEERQGPYSPVEAPDIQEAHMEPHQWWHRVGGNALPKIANRILSLTCSTSSCERNWSMYLFVHNKSHNRLEVDKAEALVYIYTNSKLLLQKPGADHVYWYDNNIFSEDLDPDDNGDETESEGNDDNGDSGIGEYVVGGAEIGGENEGGAARALNNNGGGGNADEFDWDALMAEDPIPNANRGNRSPTPAAKGGRSSHGSEDYDNIPSDDGRSYGNVRNGNDDEMAGNVQNGNNEDAPANVDTGDEVEGPLQRQDIKNGTGDGVEGSLEGEDNNGAGQSLENVNRMPAPEDKVVANTEDNIPLNVACPGHVQPTATLVGPTLVMLGNERRNASRRNASRRPPRQNTVARTNRNRESRTMQSNISFPRSVDGTTSYVLPP
jgi:hypothetical protein